MLQSVLLLNVCKLVSEQEIAKQLQEEEEIEMRRQRAATGYNNNDCVSPLCDGNYFFFCKCLMWTHASRCTTVAHFHLVPSGLGIWEQVLQDAELARRLQEEEDMLPHREVHYIERILFASWIQLDFGPVLGYFFSSIPSGLCRFWCLYYFVFGDCKYLCDCLCLTALVASGLGFPRSLNLTAYEGNLIWN